MNVRLPKGMGGGPSDMNAMIRQAQKMQEQMAEKQAELDAREYEINAGGGVVTVKIKGTKEISDILIQPEIVDPDDVETLQDILVAAVNEAIKKVESTNEQELGKITGSMNLPGMFCYDAGYGKAGSVLCFSSLDRKKKRRAAGLSRSRHGRSRGQSVRRQPFGSQARHPALLGLSGIL